MGNHLGWIITSDEAHQSIPELAHRQITVLIKAVLGDWKSPEAKIVIHHFPHSPGLSIAVSASQRKKSRREAGLRRARDWFFKN
jgi:hypothetical protein